MAKLVVVHGEAGRRELLIGGEATLGRSPACDVVLLGPLCSREHARITRVDSAYYIEDLGSANGTVVNGQTVRKAQLHDGDWISIGDHQLTFLVDDDFVAPAPAFLLDEATPTVVDTFDLEREIARIEVVDSRAVERYRSQLAAVKEVAEGACGALDVERLVDVILRVLVAAYPQSDNVHALLLGLGKGGGDLGRSSSRDAAAPSAGMSRTLLRIATEEQRAVLASDAASDIRFEDAQSIIGQNLRSIMCCPLLVRSQVLGAIQVDTTDPGRPFTADDLQLLITIAGQMAVAAENARLHAEVVAQQRLAAVGQAVSSVAHCIKNAINSLQGGAYILDLGLKKSEADRVAKGWEIVKRNTAFMSDLVGDMLAYCRKAPPRRERTDIGLLLKETAALVQETAAQKGIRVAWAVEESLPATRVDPTALKRAVLNLLTNAVEACSEGSHVEVGARRAEEGGILVVVSDDGPGIPPEVRERLFEPFFTTKGSRGTGLGLALVRKVAQEHGGDVEVESTVGSGTTFRIRIPVAAQEDETAVR